MLKTRFGKTLLGAAISVAALLGSAGPAQAAVYKGAWDPAIGGTFTDLGWEGTATFFIADSCLAQGTYTANSGCGIQILDASISFYNLSSGPASVIDTLTFNSPDLLKPLSAAMNMPIGFMTVGADSQLSGVNSDFIGSVFSTTQKEWFGIAFSGTSVDLFWTPNAPGLGLPTCAYPTNATACGWTGGANGGGSATMTITPVPEPSTYALMLAGLGAVGFVARRRRP